MIELKYGCVWGGWCIRSVYGPYGVGLWKNISRGWPFFSRHILYDIGDGSRVKFWQDRWCGETSLAVSYPDLFIDFTSSFGMSGFLGVCMLGN